MGSEETPLVLFIRTEAAKHTCKLVCEPQRVDEKESSKTSPLQRGRKDQSRKENEETQAERQNKTTAEVLRGWCLSCIVRVPVGGLK